MELKEIIKNNAGNAELVAAVDRFIASQSFTDKRAILDVFASITGFYNASQIIAVSLDKFTMLAESVIGLVIANQQDYAA